MNKNNLPQVKAALGRITTAEARKVSPRTITRTLQSQPARYTPTKQYRARRPTNAKTGS